MSLRHALGAETGLGAASGYRPPRTPVARLLALADQCSGSGNLYSQTSDPDGGWGMLHSHLGKRVPYSLPRKPQNGAGGVKRDRPDQVPQKVAQRKTEQVPSRIIHPMLNSFPPPRPDPCPLGRDLPRISGHPAAGYLHSQGHYCGASRHRQSGAAPDLATPYRFHQVSQGHRGRGQPFRTRWCADWQHHPGTTATGQPGSQGSVSQDGRTTSRTAQGPRASGKTARVCRQVQAEMTTLKISIDDILKPARLRMLFRSTMALALSAMVLVACSFSVGVTNSPPPPNAGSGPSNEHR